MDNSALIDEVWQAAREQRIVCACILFADGTPLHIDNATRCQDIQDMQPQS